MKYTVIYSSKAEKWLAKANKSLSKMIYAWVDKNLEDTEKPRQRGKALAGELSGLWRYRIGDYRIICEIRDTELVILVIEAGHRSKIYEKA